MTYSELLSLLIGLFAFLALAVVSAVLVTLGKRILIHRGPRKNARSPEPPKGMVEALRHAIGYAVLMREGGPGKEKVPHPWESLRAAGWLVELTVVKQYLSFALSERDEAERYEALQRLCEVFEESEEGQAESLAYTALYTRLRGLSRDLREEETAFWGLRAAIASWPLQGASLSRDWIGKHLETLLEGTERLASLSEQAVKITAETRESTARQPGAKAELSEDQLVRELKRLSHHYPAPERGRFREEYALLQNGISQLLVTYLPLLALEDAVTTSLVAAKATTPAPSGVRLAPEQAPLRLKPEEVRLPKFGRPRDSRIILRLENVSRETTDRVTVRWWFLASEEGAQPSQIEFLQIEILSPRATRDLTLQLGEVQAEGDLHFDIEYHGRQSQLMGFQLKVPVRYVDTFNQPPPYAANRVAQAATYFVGRSRALDHLNVLARRAEAALCVVSGLPNIGKTALLYEVQKRCEAGEEPWAEMRAAIFNLDYIQFGRPDWPSQIMQALREKITKEVGSYERESRAIKRRHSEGGAYGQFTEFLDRVHAGLAEEGDLRLLVMIDEYHRIEERYPVHSEDARQIKADFIRLLRQIADRYPRILLVLSGFHNLSFLGRKSTGTIWHDELGKVAFGKELELGFLSREEALDLIVSPMSNVGVTYKEGDGVVEEFYRETNGYPWAIQELGEKLFRQIIRRYEEADEVPGGEPLEIDRKLWQMVKEEFVRPAHHMFERVLLAGWLDRIHFAIGIALAQAEESDRISDPSGISWVDRRTVLGRFANLSALSQPNLIQRIEDLVERQILEKMEKGGRAYLRLTVPLMEEWLRRRGDFEVQLVDAGLATEAER